MKRNPHILTKTVENSIMLMDLAAGEIRILNETAGFIWKKIGSKATPSVLAKQLSQAFHVSEKQAYKDVVKFIRSYKAAGYIVSVKK